MSLRLLAALLAALIVGAPAAQAAPGDAQAALYAARALFAPPDALTALLAADEPRHATAVLRDLVSHLSELEPADRAEAESILARPTLGSSRVGYGVTEAPPYCTPNACLHYVRSTDDAPPLLDANSNLVPDYVEAAAAEIEVVWQREVTELGFRAPKPDLTSQEHGPDGRIDVYLSNIGAGRIFGYCTTDDPARTSGKPDLSAYCVLDNDYSAAEYPDGATGLDALRVTAAHELFHAVQGAYDFHEDSVLSEGTATWVEDEVYDEINDNHRYLAVSALAQPDVPFDFSGQGFQYGAFVFYRYLSDVLGPEIVRRTWEFADGAPGGPDQYSVQAIDSALRERGTTLREMFGRFALANAFAADNYAEGDAYPQPPRTRKTVSPRRSNVSGSSDLNHLTSWYVSLRPAAKVKNRSRLDLKLNLPDRERGPEASLVIVRRNGRQVVVPLPLSGSGNARHTFRFDRTVKEALLVMTNASTRYECYRFIGFACNGIPLDDGLEFRFTAKLIRR